MRYPIIFLFNDFMKNVDADASTEAAITYHDMLLQNAEITNKYNEELK